MDEWREVYRDMMKTKMRQAWTDMDYMECIHFCDMGETFGYTPKQAEHIYDLCFILVAYEHEKKIGSNNPVIRDIMNDHVIMRMYGR